MEILDITQRSAEWFAIKAGKPSPSCFDQIITTKGDRSKQREKYLYKLAGEAVAGIREDGYTSFAMQRGTEMEPEAKHAISHRADAFSKLLKGAFGNERA